MKYSRNQINRAGNTMVSSKSMDEVEDAIHLINEWRFNHDYVIDQIKPFLQELFTDNGVKPLFFSKRIKRLSSILYKLDINPDMRLGGMQDIGGLRFVFQDIDTLQDAFELLQNNVPENFSIRKINDYVNDKPKQSGYRSIHIVYEYRNKDDRYDNLRIELQIRTKLQHNWATAVETAALVTNTSLKASQGDDRWLYFFKVVSCLLAIEENKPLISDFSHYTKDYLMLKCLEMDEQNKFLETLKALRLTIKEAETKNFEDDLYLLIIDFEEKNIYVHGFKEQERPNANKQFEAEEKDAIDGKKAVVLVTVDNIRELRNAYPSYFLDTSEFISLVEVIEENAVHIKYLGKESKSCNSKDKLITL